MKIIIEISLGIIRLDDGLLLILLSFYFPSRTDAVNNVNFFRINDITFQWYVLSRYLTISLQFIMSKSNGSLL